MYLPVGHISQNQNQSLNSCLKNLFTTGDPSSLDWLKSHVGSSCISEMSENLNDARAKNHLDCKKCTMFTTIVAESKQGPSSPYVTLQRSWHETLNREGIWSTWTSRQRCWSSPSTPAPSPAAPAACTSSYPLHPPAFLILLENWII